jgi:peroxiredoxin
VAAKYGGIHAVPTTFLIDRRGKIAAKWVGGISQELVAKDLEAVL